MASNSKVIVTVAPTGSGKGIGAVIPNLLDYPGSALVLDVKGENAAVTARADVSSDAASTAALAASRAASICAPMASHC